MAKIDDIKNKAGDTIYPRTLTKAVYEEGTNKKLSDYTGDLNSHLASDVLEKHKAKQIALQDTANLFASTNVEDGMGELFTHVNNGKNLLKPTIIDKGGMVEQVGTLPTFEELNSGIESISTGGKMPPNGTNLDYEVISGIDGNDKIYIFNGDSGRIYDISTMTLEREITGDNSFKGLSEDGYVLTTANMSKMFVYDINGNLRSELSQRPYGAEDTIVYRDGNIYYNVNRSVIVVYSEVGTFIKNFQIGTNATSVGILNRERNVVFNNYSTSPISMMKIDGDLNEDKIGFNSYSVFLVTDTANW